MNDNSDLLPNLTHEDAFEVQMRGYSRRQVDEFLARCRSQIRDLEQRLARALDDSEEMRRDLATARQQALGAKPAHEEVSERIAQILKLADDEARSQKSKAHEEIARQRNDAQSEAEKIRTEAREQAERMLTAAQEQAERAITSARAEADKTVTGATNEAETIKRLTDILDGVSGLVAAETARMSLEDEVDQNTAKAIAASTESNGSPRPAAEPATAGPRPASPGGPRPAAPGSSATARPAASSPSPQATQASPTQASSAASSSAPAQDKPARAA